MLVLSLYDVFLHPLPVSLHPTLTVLSSAVHDVDSPDQSPHVGSSLSTYTLAVFEHVAVCPTLSSNVNEIVFVDVVPVLVLSLYDVFLHPLPVSLHPTEIVLSSAVHVVDSPDQFPHVGASLST